MKVMFLPDARNNNIYQTNLSNSLLKQNIQVSFDEGNVIKSIIKYRPNVIHIHWPNYLMITNNMLGTYIKSTCFISWLLLLKLFGMKIVWTVHNIAGHDGKFKSDELLFSKLLAKICNKLIVHCSSAKTEVENIYGKDLPIEIIPHGSYVDCYENVVTPSGARNKLKLGEEDIVFLCFGQIRPYKGILELIREFKELDCQKAKLLIVGKPSNNELTVDIYNDCSGDSRIRVIPEFVPDKDIQTYMNASDIVILPYKDILTSGSAILAMSFGKPIVAPSVGCMTDTFDEKGGFLYPRTERLLDVMKRVIGKNKEVLENMGIHNLELAEKLSWDNIAKKTYDTYIDCTTK